MSYETGTYATPKALFDRIVAQVQSTAFMGAGNEWQLAYSYDGWGAADTDLNRIIKSFLVPGPSGAGDFYVALQLEPSTGINTTNFRFAGMKDGAVPPWGGATWISRGTWSSASIAYAVGDVVKYSSYLYVCTMAHSSTATTPSSLPDRWVQLTSNTWLGTYVASSNWLTSYLGKVWNGGTGDIKYWLFANAQRVMFVTKSDSRYHFCYAGGYVRMGSAAQCPLPMLLAGNSTTASDAYTNASNCNFPLNGLNYGQHAVSLVAPGNRLAYTSEVYAFPPGYWGDAGAAAAIGRNPAGEYPVMPVMLGFYDNSGSNERGVVGTMDGVYGTDNRGNASENVITIGGDSYICFEDVNRGESGHFMALKIA